MAIVPAFCGSISQLFIFSGSHFCPCSILGFCNIRAEKEDMKISLAWKTVLRIAFTKPRYFPVVW